MRQKQAKSKLLREDGHVMYSDTGYLGAPERPEITKYEAFSKIEFRINKRPSSLKMADNFNGLNGDKKMENDKSSIRCKIVWKTFNFCMVFEKYDI